MRPVETVTSCNLTASGARQRDCGGGRFGAQIATLCAAASASRAVRRARLSGALLREVLPK
jgi:hypothetical protein